MEGRRGKRKRKENLFKMRIGMLMHLFFYL